MRINGEYLNGRSGHEAGRELLARTYRWETGEEMPEIAVTERGKPYFVDSPWHFSISHTKHAVFCVISKNNVGIDAEDVNRRVDLRLADKILSPGERRQFDAAFDKRMTLLEFWVLKEAYVKLTGEGLRGYPNHTDFDLEKAFIFQKLDCIVAVLEEK